MLMPKRVKRRKQFRGSMRGKATRGNVICYGEFGLVATEPCWIRSNQIEAARIAMTRYIKRGGKVWIKIFPDKPVTAKPAAAELNEELVAAKKELFNLRFQNATNQLDNTSRIKEVRRNIARIQTVITEKSKLA